MVISRNGDHPTTMGIVRVVGTRNSGAHEIVYGRPEYDGGSVRLIADAIAYMQRFAAEALEDGYLTLTVTHEDLRAETPITTEIVKLDVTEGGVKVPIVESFDERGVQ